jgi:hypothetical protein
MPRRPPPEARPRRLPRGLRLLPCWLLLLVALQQIVLVRTADLSPWLGGGFGMFSTTDGRSNRHVHLYVEHPGFEREVWVPADLLDLERRARALPSDANLRALARAIEIPPSDYGAPHTLLVQVWKTRFEPLSLIPSSFLLREFLLPLGSD